MRFFFFILNFYQLSFYLIYFLRTTFFLSDNIYISVYHNIHNTNNYRRIVQLQINYNCRILCLKCSDNTAPHSGRAQTSWRRDVLDLLRRVQLAGGIVFPIVLPYILFSRNVNKTYWHEKINYLYYYKKILFEEIPQ